MKKGRVQWSVRNGAIFKPKGKDNEHDEWQAIDIVLGWPQRQKEVPTPMFSSLLTDWLNCKNKRHTRDATKAEFTSTPKWPNLKITKEKPSNYKFVLLLH